METDLFEGVSEQQKSEFIGAFLRWIRQLFQRMHGDGKTDEDREVE